MIRHAGAILLATCTISTSWASCGREREERERRKKRRERKRRERKRRERKTNGGSENGATMPVID